MFYTSFITQTYESLAFKIYYLLIQVWTMMVSSKVVYMNDGMALYKRGFNGFVTTICNCAMLSNKSVTDGWDQKRFNFFYRLEVEKGLNFNANILFRIFQNNSFSFLAMQIKTSKLRIFSFLFPTFKMSRLFLLSDRHSCGLDASLQSVS